MVPELVGPTIVAPPTFVSWFSLFLIPTHSENLIHLPPTVKKVKILDDSFVADPPNVAP